MWQSPDIEIAARYVRAFQFSTTTKRVSLPYMNYRFVERVRALAVRRGRPLRKLFVEKISQNMLATFRGTGREIGDEECDSIADSKIIAYLDNLEAKHDHLFIPIESPEQRLDHANKLALNKPPAPAIDAKPRRMELSDSDRETVKGLSPAQRLDYGNGCFVAREFQKNE